MTIQKVPYSLIDDNPFQPRSYYHPDAIRDLATSIYQVGIIHIPAARQVANRYQVAEGHLRVRACLKNHKDFPKDERFEMMPLDVKEISDKEMALIALEENLRRKDITPLDTARAVDKYLTTFTDSTEADLAEKMNTTQAHISNMRRVLRLPAKVLEKVNEDKINFTMARELCILQGVIPTKGRYGRALTEEEKTDEHLMMEAVRGVTGQYGTCTVAGIKKAIYDTVKENFACLNEREYYGGEETLFDIKKAGCAKCEKMLRANKTQSQTNMFCLDRACWEKKQQAHKDQAAQETQARMAKDLANRVLQDQKKIAAQGSTGTGAATGTATGKDIPQGISGGEAEYRFTQKADGGLKYVNANSPRQALERLGFKQEDGTLEVRISPRKWVGVSATPAAEFIHAIHTNAAEALLSKDDVAFLEKAQAVELSQETTQETIHAQQRRHQLSSMPNYPCLTCPNIGKCDGTHVYATDDRKEPGYPYKCDQKVTTAPEKVTANATVAVPSGLLDKVKDTAGSRAQILDLYQLRVGSYGSELSHGHQLLDSVMSQMDDPQECMERCTKGFHYAFDSKQTTRGTFYVCTDPKCCSQKKAAFTRSKNARGMLRKRAEAEAIKAVVKATDRVLDAPRIELIFLANLMGAHVNNSYSYGTANDNQDWLVKKLKVNTDATKNLYGEGKKKAVALLLLKVIKELPFLEMCQLLVEFMLERLRYDGAIGDYRITTTEALALFKVHVQVPKESEEPDKRSNPSNTASHANDEEEGGEEDGGAED
jgi:ParB/RepB/Spo0J family partition protein